MKIRLPYNYEPRPYQLPVLQAFDSGRYKRFVDVWHRRAGKDKTWVNKMVIETQKKVGQYYYFFPTYAQGRKILWEGIDKDGFKVINHFPRQLLAKDPNNTEMKIDFANGSLFRVIGTDNINDVVGTNPIGNVFSEYALQSPLAWDYVRPILAENGGWAAFDYTPRGANHGKDLYEMAKDNPEWYCDLLTVDDTHAISAADIQAERVAGMDEDLIQQEFYCSFSGSVQGAYYSEQIKSAIAEGRIGTVPYDMAVPVHTAWDLGIGDAMAVWFYQLCGKEIRFIEYYECQGRGLTDCIAELQHRPYVYGWHYAPHDIQVRELSTGKSRLDLAHSLGVDFIVAPKLGIGDGIDAGRRIFNRCYFDKVKCKSGINALTGYHKEYDEKRKIFYDMPCHDYCSHGADAYRTFALTFRDKLITVKSEVYRHQSTPRVYNPMTV